MIQKYYDHDCNLGLLDGKTIAILGYGSQGHAHALNLHESGVDVVVGLRKDSASWKKAEEAGLKVMEVDEAAKAGDFVMMLVPDELAADIYAEKVAPNLVEGNVLMFAHGFNIHFNQIKAPKDVDVIMVAPKGPGHTVRSQYLEGKGVPSLIAVYQDVFRPRQGLCAGLCLRHRRGPCGHFGNHALKKKPKPTCSVNRLCCAAA